MTLFLFVVLVFNGAINFSVLQIVGFRWSFLSLIGDFKFQRLILVALLVSFLKNQIDRGKNLRSFRTISL